MPATTKIRNVVFGEGIPKICIPLTDAGPEDLKKSTEAMQKAPFDFTEWRADFYKDIENPEIRFQALAYLREQLKETPLLFTVRTSLEGGKLEIQTEHYRDLILSVIDSGLADMVDVELSRGDDTMSAIVDAAHKNGVKVVASFHDFSQTPSRDTIVERLCRMQRLGADIAKTAVTPQNSRDVLTLLDATLTMREEHAETPVITMSMGKLGVVSRVCGSVFGSCVTFGTAGNSSAPGQLPADLLSTILDNMG